MITASELIRQAETIGLTGAQAQPQVVYVQGTSGGGAGRFFAFLLSLVIAAGGIAVGSGWIKVSGVATPPVVSVNRPVQQPTVVVSAPAQPAVQPVVQPAVQSDIQIVPDANKPIRVQQPTLAPTGTPDPNLTRLVAMLNSTPTPVVAGPPECNSQNATFKSHTTAVDDKGIPVGFAEGWSCDSQAAADAEADRRAKEILAAKK